MRFTSERVMWKHHANYKAATFKHFSNMVLVSNKILYGLQHKNMKEVMFYLHKFKSHCMVYIITLNNGKKPILINKKTEVRALDDPSLLSSLAINLLTYLWYSVLRKF